MIFSLPIERANRLMDSSIGLGLNVPVDVSKLGLTVHPRNGTKGEHVGSPSMTRRPEIRTAKLTRMTQNGQTLCFTTPHLPKRKSHRSRLTFVRPEHVPEFEGEDAWFDLELVPAKPWPYWRVLAPAQEPAWSKQTTW